ncbi:MAG: four helix bundle protein [Thermodesulfobacteriota bacterium]
MKGNEGLRERFYSFVLEVIKFGNSLFREMVAFEMGKQLLRSGCSIAANYEEATGAFSTDDFIYKLSIAFKEAKETNLWLRLFKDSGISGGERVQRLIQESEEVRNILGRSVVTAKRKRTR